MSDELGGVSASVPSSVAGVLLTVARVRLSTQRTTSPLATLVPVLLQRRLCGLETTAATVSCELLRSTLVMAEGGLRCRSPLESIHSQWQR